jgi:hypothetical protein
MSAQALREGAKERREHLLDPVERVSEFMFGLFMALTFVGAVSVATDGAAEIRTMFIAAFGCNIAWGLVDGVMYVVQNVTERGRSYTLALAVRAAQPEAGRDIIRDAMPSGLAKLASPAEIEAMRMRLLDIELLPARPTLQRHDLLGGLGIFLMCVVATFPVVLPFIFFTDVGTAKAVSRAVALAMLFLGGFILGRYAGYGGWKAGTLMTILGTLLVAAIMALGG